MVKPKKLPQLATIAQPRSGSEIALDWAKVVVPALGTVAGLHYGYKAIQSSNEANVATTQAYTGNFKNNSNTVTSNTSVDKSISDSVTVDKSVSDSVSIDKSSTDNTSITDTANSDTTQTTVPVTVDGTTTTVGP